MSKSVSSTSVQPQSLVSAIFPILLVCYLMPGWPSCLDSEGSIHIRCFPEGDPCPSI
jgi:hypothetical protein